MTYEEWLHVKGSILTYSGVTFDFEHPERNDYNVEDIAWALSNLCRYNGHCTRFYSVAEHSSLMAQAAAKVTTDQKLIRSMLLHDAAEAYVGDMARPLKALFPEFKKLERTIQAEIAKRFDTYTHSSETDLVKQYDFRIFGDEYMALMPHRDTDVPHERDLLHVDIKGLAPRDAYLDFMSRYIATRLQGD